MFRDRVRYDETRGRIDAMVYEWAAEIGYPSTRGGGRRSANATNLAHGGLSDEIIHCQGLEIGTDRILATHTKSRQLRRRTTPLSMSLSCPRITRNVSVTCALPSSGQNEVL